MCCPKDRQYHCMYSMNTVYFIVVCWGRLCYCREGKCCFLRIDYYLQGKLLLYELPCCLCQCAIMYKVLERLVSFRACKAMRATVGPAGCPRCQRKRIIEKLEIKFLSALEYVQGGLQPAKCFLMAFQYPLFCDKGLCLGGVAFCLPLMTVYQLQVYTWLLRPLQCQNVLQQLLYLLFVGVVWLSRLLLLLC